MLTEISTLVSGRKIKLTEKARTSTLTELIMKGSGMKINNTDMELSTGLMEQSTRESM